MDGSTRIPRRLDPEERRERIVAAAICHFAEHGLGGTTRELAQRAGITQALLYRYFASKEALLEAVFERVYLNRLQPNWIEEIRDRRLPIAQRLVRFYRQYAVAIFSYEWLRIFMYAGLAGERLNRRYLSHVADRLLVPLREEIIAAGGLAEPDMEEMWALHGGIVYIGIRRHIYGLPTPDDPGPVIERQVARFLAGLRAPQDANLPPEPSPAASPRPAARGAAGRSGRATSRR